ncbi:MAG: class I SAM-dependent methyltransferase [Alphaproteobacteria bacterium]|nr:class I SAM-dependent methyltransferase [Alphaproteobacteria bacterium]
MKYHYRILLATALSFFPVSSGLSMTQEEQDAQKALGSTISPELDLREFVKSVVPDDSSDKYIDNVTKVWRNTINSPKREILQDNDLQLGVGEKDYGYNFPSILCIQKKLLEFCAQADHEVHIADVGPGFGYDSLMALLTKKAKVTAFEKQEAQCEALQFTVKQTIFTQVDPNFPEDKFSALHADFLEAPTLQEHTFDGINVNKVIHFFNPKESKVFKEKINFFLKPGGRLFLTCLTPSPDTEIDKFMKSSKEEFPGYLFYRLETELTESLQFGVAKLKEVRKPADYEESAYYLETHKQEGSNLMVTIDRVMHYHTFETLTRFLGGDFKILETCIIPPKENMGTDQMISIVAEKL